LHHSAGLVKILKGLSDQGLFPTFCTVHDVETAGTDFAGVIGQEPFGQLANFGI